MDALTSMKEKLSPLGIYQLFDSNIEDELYVYACELDRLRERSDVLLREAFVSTAEDEGLSVIEKIYGRERTDLPLETRRDLIKKRLSVGLSDFTPEGIRTALESFDFDYLITEYPTLCKLNILATAEYTEAEERWIEREVQRIIPSHIEFQLVFNTLSWDQLDAFDRSFAQIEYEDLSWEESDRRKE